MTKISQLSSIGDSLAIGDQFLIRDIDDTGSPNKSVTISGITRALDIGTALAPAIAFAGDKNTGIYSPGADTLAFVEGGTEVIRIDSSGNVGIGTSFPNARLEVQAPSTGRSYTSSVLDFSNIHLAGATANITTSALTFTSGGGGGAAVAFSRGSSTDTQMSFWTNSAGGANAATERMVIDSSGRLLVGTPSARTISSAFMGGGGATADFQVEGQFLAIGSFSSNRNDSFGPYLAFVKSRGTTANSFTLVNNGDVIGALSFNGTDGSAALAGAAITALVEGTPGANDMPGCLVFSTTADGASIPTERLRISSNGRVGIGLTSPGANLHINNNAALSSVPAIGSLGGLFNATVGSNAYGLVSGALNSGAYFFQSQTTDGTSATYPILLNPNGGNVGIKTTAPLEKLHVDGNIALDNEVLNTPKYIHFRSNAVATEYGGIKWYNFQWNNTIRASITSGPDGAVANGYLAFSTGNSGLDATEKMRIDTSGRLLIGMSTARSLGSFSTALQVEGTSFSGSSISITNNENTANGAFLNFGKSRGASIGSNTVVNSGDNIAHILFYGANGSGTTPAAAIDVQVDGAPGANDMPGRLVFSTTADGAASSTEAMRINNQRELLIGTTTRTANGGVLQVSNGITFPATAVACTDVNTLDDYEEGTWTPSLGGTATYTSRSGTYTKVGRLVTVTFQLVVNAIGTGSTTIVSGLPFSPVSDGWGAVYWSSAVQSLGYSAGYAFAGGSAVQLYSTTGVSTGLTAANVFTSGTDMRATVTYFV